MTNTTSTGSKSADQYLIQAAIELCPKEEAHSMESLREWMTDNMNQIAEKASDLQSQMINKFFASESSQEKAKQHLGGKVYDLARI